MKIGQQWESDAQLFGVGAVGKNTIYTDAQNLGI
jgi:hypothetical protein